MKMQRNFGMCVNEAISLVFQTFDIGRSKCRPRVAED